MATKRYSHISLPSSNPTIGLDICLSTTNSLSEASLKQAVKSIRFEIFGKDTSKSFLPSVEIYCDGNLLFENEDILNTELTETSIHYSTYGGPYFLPCAESKFTITLQPNITSTRPFMDLINPSLSARTLNFVVNYFDKNGTPSKTLILHDSVVTEYKMVEKEITLTIVPSIWTVDYNNMND